MCGGDERLCVGSKVSECVMCVCVMRGRKKSQVHSHNTHIPTAEGSVGVLCTNAEVTRVRWDRTRPWGWFPPLVSQSALDI